MAIEIVLPRLGWTMEEGALVEWMKQDGEEVKAGDILFTVESDKAINEVESFDTGILRIPPDSPPPGATVPVGTRLAYILQPGEELPPSAPAPKIAAVAATHQEQAVPSTLTAPLSQGRRTRPAISPRARRLARQLGVDFSQLKGSGSTGRIAERDIRAASRAPRVSPLARRVAQEAGVSLEALAAQNPGARLQRQDVEAAIAGRSAPPGESVSLSSRRRIIAQRLAQSSRTTAPVTLFCETDATELVLLREKFKEALAAAPTYNDLLLKLTAIALTEHPQLNASWQGDSIQEHGEIHLGMAVDTQEGLLVPVLRDADRKSLQQLAQETADLAARARERRLGPDQLQGATFTLTNLGMYHIDAFTPIIDLPQCAILGVGRIALRPAVHQGQVVPRHLVSLSLTFDHRVVDGGPAARFLDTVRQYVEQPHLWLAR